MAAHDRARLCQLRWKRWLGFQGLGVQGCRSQHVWDPPTLVTKNLFPNLSLAHPPSPNLNQMAEGVLGSQALA